MTVLQALFQTFKSIGNKNSIINPSYILKGHIIKAENHHKIASDCIESDDYQKAYFHYTTSLNIRIKELGEDDSSILKTYTKLGITCVKLNKHEEAITHFQKASSINKALHGIKHISVALNNNNIAETYKALGQHDKAFEYFNQALLYKGDLFDENYKLMAIIYNNIAATYEDLGNHKEAFSHYLKACLIHREHSGDDHYETKKLLKSLEETINEIYYYEYDPEQCIEEAISTLMDTEKLRHVDLEFLVKYDIIPDKKTPVATSLLTESSLIEEYVDIHNLPTTKATIPTEVSIKDLAVQIHLVGEDIV